MARTRGPAGFAAEDRFERAPKVNKDDPPRPGRGLRIAGWTTMGLGLAALALTPAIGLAPGAALIALAQLLLVKGGAKPLD